MYGLLFMYVCAAGQGVVFYLSVLNKVYNFGINLIFLGSCPPTPPLSQHLKPRYFPLRD